jgi:hypothetical protein
MFLGATVLGLFSSLLLVGGQFFAWFAWDYLDYTNGIADLLRSIGVIGTLTLALTAGGVEIFAKVRPIPGRWLRLLSRGISVSLSLILIISSLLGSSSNYYRRLPIIFQQGHRARGPYISG